MASFNWATATKEQKQYIVLGGIVALALVYVLYTVVSGLGAGDKEGAAAGADLDKLKSDVESAELAIKQERQLTQDYESTLAYLEKEAAHYFPNEDNRYSWVTELIYSMARALSVEVQSINEIAFGQEVAPEGGFSRYGVQVSLLASYSGAISFIEHLEENNPLVRVTRISISRNDKDFLTLNVVILAEWPTSMDVKRSEKG